MNFSNLFKKSAPPPMSPVETALLESLRSSPDRWFFREGASGLLQCTNNEKAVTVMCDPDAAATECGEDPDVRAYCGKLQFGSEFATAFADLALPLHRSRVETADQVEAKKIEAAMARALGL